MREKHSKQKICIIMSHTQFVFRLFLYNVKKTICIENRCFQGALGKMHLLRRFHRQNKIEDFISFTKARHTASQTLFFFFLNKKEKFEKKISNILLFYAIVCGFVLFFMETCKIIFRSLWHCWQLNPLKMICVSTIQVKNCGRRYISCSQKLAFHENGKTHQYELYVKYIM